jgi:hypothetical protein
LASRDASRRKRTPERSQAGGDSVAISRSREMRIHLGVEVDEETGSARNDAARLECLSY